MNPETDTNAPAAAVKSLAAIGFVTLIAAGIWLAVIASRYIPDVVGSIGSAAVSLSQIFNPEPESPGTIATSTPATTTPATSTPATATSTPTATSTQATTTAPKPGTGVKYPGKETTGTIPIGGTTGQSGALYGLPDLSASIDAIGYLSSASSDSFVATTTVPNGMRPAVRFTIRNAGTNLAKEWRFSASLPTQSGFVYQSPVQQVLAPGDRIQYTLGFDQPRYGANQPIDLLVNFDNAVAESNTKNNEAIALITVIGS